MDVNHDFDELKLLTDINLCIDGTLPLRGPPFLECSGL